MNFRFCTVFSLLGLGSLGLKSCTAKRIETQFVRKLETIDGGGMNASTRVEPAFFLVQVADPQLGMLNLAGKTVDEAKDFQDELGNLQDAVEKIKKLKPSLVVMSGDMQNFWSANKVVDGTPQNFVLGPDSGLGDYGDVQAQAVKDAMGVLQKDGIKVVFTPGNHDLDDVVTEQTLTRYKGIWGSDYYSFWVGNVFFISMNSQLYYEREVEPYIARYRQQQTEWIQSKIEAAQKRNPTAIVALTHIPPFIGSPVEKHGWANWDETFRTTMFENVMDADLEISPELWLCGHFHGNVRSTVVMSGRPVEIMTTGSVGASMLWNNTLANEYTPSHASTIAQAPSGGAAFGKHIVDGDPVNIAQRISTSRDLSGLRVVQFFTNGQYRHKWFTLEEFGAVSAIDDASMADAYKSASWEDLPEQKL